MERKLSERDLRAWDRFKRDWPKTHPGGWTCTFQECDMREAFAAGRNSNKRGTRRAPLKEHKK